MLEEIDYFRKVCKSERVVFTATQALHFTASTITTVRGRSSITWNGRGGWMVGPKFQGRGRGRPKFHVELCLRFYQAAFSSGLVYLSSKYCLLCTAFHQVGWQKKMSLLQKHHFLRSLMQNCQSLRSSFYCFPHFTGVGW